MAIHGMLAQVAGATHVGSVRTENEDCCMALMVGSGQVVVPDPIRGAFSLTDVGLGDAGILVVVADGVGGNRGGREASQIVCQRVCSEASARLSAAVGDRAQIEAALLATVSAVNAHVRREAASGRGGPEMAATALILYVESGFIYLANVGDSRLYLLRGGRLVQRTIDQVGASPGDGEQRHFDLLQAVGWESIVEPEIGVGKLVPGDTYLLCTDGVYKELSNPAIRDILAARDGDPELCVESLIHEAIRSGGRDNVTCIVLQVAKCHALEYSDQGIVVGGSNDFGETDEATDCSGREMRLSNRVAPRTDFM